MYLEKFGQWTHPWVQVQKIMENHSKISV